MKPRKPKILILGKTPPPIMGPSIATQIILNSSLKDTFRLIHVQTRLGRQATRQEGFGISKAFFLLKQYMDFTLKLVFLNPDLILVPISQTISGFKKDSFYIQTAALFKKKCIVHLRGSNFRNVFNQANKNAQEYMRNTLNKCQGAIVLGQKLKPIFEGIFPSEQIFVVPNGANYDIPQKKKNGNIFTCTYLGNLQTSKGIEDVIEAIRINKRKPGIKLKLNIMGSFRNKSDAIKLKQYIAEHQLPVEFHFLVTGKKKFELLKASDVLVFAPREPEGHPWVIIEALACSLPVIATDQGAITESVIDGRNGFIVPVRSPYQIAQKLELLYSDHNLKEAMSLESFKMYQQHFTEKKMIQNLTACLLTVLEKN